jgi:hypothetical protein
MQLAITRSRDRISQGGDLTDTGWNVTTGGHTKMPTEVLNCVLL